MKITIDPFNEKSIDEALRIVRERQNWIEEKQKELVTRLGEIGKVKAEVIFNQAIYDGTNDVKVHTEVEGNTVKIIANGEAVAFIEFGTGIKEGNGYLGHKPDGIVGIGQYGHGRGNNPKGWLYPLENGLGSRGEISTKNPNMAHTYGNPPAMAMYQAVLEIQNQVTQIAREVFQ